MLIPSLIFAGFLVCSLAKKGMISPFLAGGLAVALCSHFHTNYSILLFAAITYYVTTFLASSWAEEDNVSLTNMAMLPEIAANGKLNFCIKAGTLILFCFIPIPKPDFYITGIAALLVIGGILFANQEVKYSLGTFSVGLIIQILLFTGVTFLFNRFGATTNPSLAIVSAIAIPSLTSKSYAPPSIDSHNLHLDPLSLITALTLTYLTPGLSTSALSTSLFPRGISQAAAAAFLEAAVEGWVINLICHNQLSGKSTLGDLLNLDTFQWGTFSVSTSTGLLILAAIPIAITLCLITPSPTFKPSPYIAAAILTTQAVVTAGPIFTTLFLAAGFTAKWLNNNPSSNTLSFIAPTLL